MNSIADKILTRVRGHGCGNWVCTPKDFLDLGSRDGVDRALSRLAAQGKLRRIDRGFYDYPRYSNILKRDAPPDMNTIVAAIARRDGIKILPDGIVAAHQLGLTNAVPAQHAYLTNGTNRTLKIGNRTVQLRHAPPKIVNLADRPSASVVIALDWLGQNIANAKDTIDILRRQLSPTIKRALEKDLQRLPSWMILIVRQLNQNEAVAS